ncbi:TIR domain-containing protein [Frankia sp. AgB32]|nr:TIR domain-containing protein [Frankia sp. AgB32]
MEEAGFSVLSRDLFSTTENWDRAFRVGLRSGSGVVVLFSRAYLRSLHGQGEWQAVLGLPDAPVRQLLIRLDDCAVPAAPATADVIDLVGLDERAARDRILGVVRAAAAAEGRAAPEPERRPIVPLERVFRSVGVPALTFVEPIDYVDFRVALRSPGVGVVLEGPAGIGKTTLLQWAMRHEELRLGRLRTFTARSPHDVARLGALSDADLTGVIAVDDFHRLPLDVQRTLVDRMKLLADSEDDTSKIVVVGIPDTGRALMSLSYDIGPRLQVFSLGSATYDQILSLITKGERVLNIRFEARSDLVDAAGGSLATAQSLCKAAAALSRVEETMPGELPTVVRLDLQTARAWAMRQLQHFKSAVDTFAGLDGPEETACIALLNDLAASSDGSIVVRDVCQRRPELTATLTRVFADAADRFAPGTELGRLFHYDARSSRLSTDDPQLGFYLRNLDRAAMRAAAGKHQVARRQSAFICYSHRDSRWLERLVVHLSPLERAGLLDVWSDRRISLGDDWQARIEVALDAARIAVLLVSADFLDSTFIRTVELPQLIAAAAAGGCRIIPILVSASQFPTMPDLNRYKHANPGGRTLNALDGEAAEEVLATIAGELTLLLEPPPSPEPPGT